MASLLDPDLAPDGCHVIHAYVPATEPYERWAGVSGRAIDSPTNENENA